MSVNTSEEYLDELLQAVEPIICVNEPIPEPEKPEEAISNTVNTDSFTEDVTMDDLLAAITSEEASEISEEVSLESDSDAMLSPVASTEDSIELTDYGLSAHDEDVKELLKQFTNDEDLSDINDILEKNDNSEAIDEALLKTPDVEVFQMETEETDADETDGETGKKSGGIFSFLKKSKDKKKDKKKRGKKAKEEETDTQEETNVTDVLSVSSDDITATGEQELFFGLEAGALGDAPRGDIEIESENGEMDETQAVSELGLNALFGDGDTADIEQLLTGGSFDEIIPVKRNNEKEDDSKKEDKKKGSFFSRFIDMLMEEDEEEENGKTAKKGNIPEADATGVTDENIAILDELSKEDRKRAKKEQKEQKKKEKEAKKKGKAVAVTEGDGEESEVDGQNNKKSKKPKKTKTRKVQVIDDKPEKKLSRKKVSLVFAFCFSILAMILILQTVLLNQSNLKAARWAFDNEDYETCYANLYGEELSEADQLIFDKSYVILCVQRKLDSYENFIRMDMEVEALNALFEGVRVYRDMEERAAELNVSDRIHDIYQTVWEKLYAYGLSESDVEEILNYESRVTYTKHLQAIVNGTTFDAEDFPPEADENVLEEDANLQPLEDVLLQEEDFLPDDTGLPNDN